MSREAYFPLENSEVNCVAGLLVTLAERCLSCHEFKHEAGEGPEVDKYSVTSSLLMVELLRGQVGRGPNISMQQTFLIRLGGESKIN